MIIYLDLLFMNFKKMFRVVPDRPVWERSSVLGAMGGGVNVSICLAERLPVGLSDAQIVGCQGFYIHQVD